MNILQVIPYFVPAGHYGGPVQVTYGTSKEMVKRGHKVTVYATDTLNANGRVEGKEEVMDGIEVKRFRNLSNTLAYRHKIFLSPGMLMANSKELNSFDIIHMHEYRSIQNVIAHHHAKKYNIPYVFGAYGSLANIMSKRRLKQLFDNLWGYRLVNDASKLIAMTPTEVEQYRELGVEESKIVQIPNSIDIDGYEQLPEKGTFRKKYSITDEHIVLFLGRINKIKGIDILVKAVAELMEEGRSIRLVIIGSDDGYLPALKELIKDLKIEEKVILTGFIPTEMKLAAYVDADVYVLPSIYETFPTTVLEAGACGTPVIVTDRCQIAPLVKNELGLVVSYDKDELRDALLRILTDEKMRTRFRETGRALVREKYTWSRCADQIETVYEEVVTGHDG